MGGSGGGSRRRRRYGGSNGTLSEINVVPLVDVVLVLLIIFMLTAHVMDYGLKVEVPKVAITEQSPDVYPTVTIGSDLTLHLNEMKVNINDLPAQIEKRFKGQKIVYVAADKSVRWDIVANVMAALRGFQIKAVLKPLDGKGR
jgi:biopolymer transport protein ExbD